MVSQPILNGRRRQPLSDIEKVCPVSMRAVYDALEFLGGKWKLPILFALFMGGKQRFREMGGFSNFAVSFSIISVGDGGVETRRASVNSIRE